MLDIRKRKHFVDATVSDIRKALRKLPQDMRVFFNGQAEGFLHVGANGKFCCFDNDELAESYSEQEEAMTKLMEAVAEFGIASAWTDNDIIEALVSMGITREDFEKRGKGDFVKDYYDEEEDT